MLRPCISLCFNWIMLVAITHHTGMLLLLAAFLAVIRTAVMVNDDSLALFEVVNELCFQFPLHFLLRAVLDEVDNLSLFAEVLPRFRHECCLSH